MTTIRNLLNWLGICAITGALVGVFTGFVFEMIQLGHAGTRPTGREVFLAGIVLGIAGWLMALLLIGAISKFGILAMAIQSLATSLVVGILTALVDGAIWRAALSVWIGLIIGILVGRALCLACQKGYVQKKPYA